MIKTIDISSSKNAEDVLNIQIPSYKVEAEIIGSDEIPPLNDTVHTLQHCGELSLVIIKMKNYAEQYL